MIFTLKTSTETVMRWYDQHKHQSFTDVMQYAKSVYVWRISKKLHVMYAFQFWWICIWMSISQSQKSRDATERSSIDVMKVMCKILHRIQRHRKTIIIIFFVSLFSSYVYTLAYSLVHFAQTIYFNMIFFFGIENGVAKVFNRIRVTWAYLNLFKNSPFFGLNGRRFNLHSQPNAFTLFCRQSLIMLFISIPFKFTYAVFIYLDMSWKAFKPFTRFTLCTRVESPWSHFTYFFSVGAKSRAKCINCLSGRENSTNLFVLSGFFSFFFYSQLTSLFWCESFSLKMKSQN